MFKIKTLLLVFLASFGVGVLSPVLVYGQSGNSSGDTSPELLIATHEAGHEEPPDAADGEETEEPETCLALTFANTITFGWILCPIMSFLANLVQDMFEWVLGKSPISGEEYCNLVVEFDDTGTRDCGTEFDRTQVQETWNAFRVLANAFFVLAFLYAIYQVAFASGNNAYLIKSMLPRLAAAAVMVQLSFFFTEILINWSNEFGSYIDQLFNWVFRDDQEFSLGGIIFGADDSIEDIIFNKIALAATAVLLFFSWTTILASVGLSMLVVFLVLVARKLLILMAVVLAPIAAITWIHPQTDGFAKAWWQTFSKLLLMYPLIILLIRSGELMARASSGTGDDAIFDLVRFIAFFAPFFLIPFTFRFAGGLIGQAAGFANNASKGLVDKARGIDQERRARGKQDALADVRKARQNNYKPTAVKRFQAGLLGNSFLYGKKGAEVQEAEKTAEALSTEQRIARAGLTGRRVELEAQNMPIRMAELEDSQRKFEIDAVVKHHERDFTGPSELTSIARDKNANPIERIGAATRLTQIQDRDGLNDALAGMAETNNLRLAQETVSRNFPDINNFAPEQTGYITGADAVDFARFDRKQPHQIGAVSPDSIKALTQDGTPDQIAARQDQIRNVVQSYIEADTKNQPTNYQAAGHLYEYAVNNPGIFTTDQISTLQRIARRGGPSGGPPGSPPGSPSSPSGGPSDVGGGTPPSAPSAGGAGGARLSQPASGESNDTYRQRVFTEARSQGYPVVSPDTMSHDDVQALGRVLDIKPSTVATAGGVADTAAVASQNLTWKGSSGEMAVTPIGRPYEDAGKQVVQVKDKDVIRQVPVEELYEAPEASAPVSAERITDIVSASSESQAPESQSATAEPATIEERAQKSTSGRRGILPPQASADAKQAIEEEVQGGNNKQSSPGTTISPENSPNGPTIRPRRNIDGGFDEDTTPKDEN